MKNIIHYAISLDTCGVLLNDGSKAVCLSFNDKESGECHNFPIPIDIAEDLGPEISRLVGKLREEH